MARTDCFSQTECSARVPDARPRPPCPRFNGVMKFAEFLRDRPHPFGAEGVARLACAGLDDVEPCALTRDLFQWKFALLWNSQQGEPVDPGVILCRLRWSRRDDRIQ